MDRETLENLRLWLPDQDRALCDPDEINSALREVGAAVWPLEIGTDSERIQELLKAPVLDQAQIRLVMDHFLLSREQLLELIIDASRTPGTEGGGALSTTDKTHAVVYPQLYQVVNGIDYSRFDRFHVNRSLTKTRVDEVMHVLCGRGIILHQQIPDRGVFRLEIDCPADHGWTVTYDGDLPHIGSISGASPGAKILMQIIGPAEWEMIYC